MSGDASYAQEIVAAYPRLLTENYCIIASSALLWFDFALTLPTEYRRIWKRRFTGATIVYLFTRYIAVIERIFFVLEVLVWNSSDKANSAARCGGITHTDDTLLFLNYLAFSAFTCLRVYGVWGRDWKPLLVVLPLTLVKPLCSIYEATRYIPVQAGPPFGCVYIYTLSDSLLSKYVHFSATTKATTIAADGILIVLTWIKTFGIKRDSMQAGVRAPLATLLLRDGTAYFLVLLVIQLVTIISNKVSPSCSLTIWLVWPYFDQVLTVIFLSRFMLDLRGLYFADRARCDAESSLHWSDVQFHGFTAANVVGNMGATLSTTLTLSMHSDVSEYEPSHAGDGRSGPAFSEGEDEGAGERRNRYEMWELADDLPEYSSDPFALGMRTAAAADSMVKVEKPSSLSTGEFIDTPDLEKQPVSAADAAYSVVEGRVQNEKEQQCSETKGDEIEVRNGTADSANHPHAWACRKKSGATLYLYESFGSEHCTMHPP
ncbi:hypothetical protein C8Q70DRAFT_927948 [Cubamyces menziesii]|nr:hypothetical protein C8Q70DRAFT_927948 [Cubamyces menziesii]